MSQKISVTVNSSVKDVLPLLTRPDVVIVFGGNEYTTPEEKMRAYELWDDLRMQSAKQAAPAQKLSFKVGEKGGVSIYGLNARFPMTLYVEQWERLFAVLPDLKEFIRVNSGRLTRKSGKIAA